MMSIEIKQRIRFIVEIMLAVLVIMSTVINFAVSNARKDFNLDQIKIDTGEIKESLRKLEKQTNDHLIVAQYKIAQLDALQKDFDDVKLRVKSLEQ